MGNIKRRAGAVLALGLVATAFASADLITQTATFSTFPTDVSGAQTAATFQGFRAAGAPDGAVLDSVYLEMSLLEEITGLSISANPGSTQFFTYESTAQFTIGGSAPDAGNLNSGLPGGPLELYTIGDFFYGDAQAINANQTLTYVGAGALSAGIDPSLIGQHSSFVGNGLGKCNSDLENSIPGTGPNCVDLNPLTYTVSFTDLLPSAYDNAGSFTLNYTTLTGEGFSSGGGNLNFSQQTVTSANYTIVYNYHTPEAPGVPEPASMLLMGSALLGLGFVRKRLKS